MQCVSQTTASPTSLEADDDEPNSQTALEKILQLNSVANAIQPLLDYLKQHNNALYSLVASFQVSDTTASRSRHRGGRKERKDRSRRDTTGSMGTKSPSDASAASHLSALEKVALCVAKGVGEGSVASLLSAVAVLFVLMKDDNASINDPPTLPIGNIVAAVFTEPDQSSGSSDKEFLRNPFQLYLQASKRLRSASVANSEESHGDMSSAEESRDESASQPGTYGAGASDAGSTVGSMLAELGTETTSIMGDEPSEDDVLAQALALSMAENYNGQAEEGYIAKLDKGMSEELETAVQDVLSYSETCLPFAPPLSSLGMLTSQNFWSSLYSGSNALKRLRNNQLPAQHAVVALLTALNIAVDQACDEKCLTTDEDGNIQDAILPVAINIKLDSSAEAFSMCEFLVEHLKGALVQHSSMSNQDINASQWHSHHHFLCWALHSTLKVLKGLFSNVGSDRSFATMLFRSPLPTESELLSGIGGLRSSMSRLRLHVLDISGLQNTGVGESVRLFDIKYPSALTQQGKIGMMSYADSISTKAVVQQGLLSCFHSAGCLNHTLRLVAIEVISSGIRIFLPDGMSRLKLLDAYLSTCPTCPPELRSYGTAQFIEKMLSLSDENISSQVWSESWYENYYLQSLCLYVVKADECLDQFLLVVQSDSASKCFTATNKALQDSLAKREKVLVMKSLQGKLLHRLSSIKDVHSSPQLHYGVVATGLCIQLFFTECCSLLCGSSPAQCDFSSVKIHPCLTISRDMKTVLHSGPKLWASVLSTTSLQPNCGIFEWAVQVDRCTKGHVFLGIATQDAGVSSNFTDAYYVGVDKHSWGLIGTRSLWHNKSKIIADFGSGFSTGSVVVMRYNSDAGTLAYKTQDSEWATAFESLPKVPMFPAFSLHENGDQLSLLYCEKIESKERKDRSPAHSLNLQLLRDGTKPLIVDIFIDYVNDILSTVDSLMLDSAQSGSDLVNNPLIGTWLSSLLGYFVSTKSLMPRSLVISILPLMLSVARRLVYISEKSKSADLSRQLKDGLSFSVVGHWTTFTFSGIVGGNVQGTNTFQITSENPLEAFIANSNDVASLHNSAKIVSSCSILGGSFKYALGGFAACSVSGYRLDEKIKLVGKPANSTVKTWDAKLSLCGRFMMGYCQDEKTSKFQYFESVKRCTANEQISVTRVSKVCANLAVAAASRLSVLLITLLNNDEVRSDIDEHGERLGEDDSDGERSQTDPAGEELGVFAPLVKSGNLDGEDPKRGIIEEEDASETGQLHYWLRSNLLRCGLKFSDRVAEEIRHVLSKKIPQALAVDDFNVAEEQVEGKSTSEVSISAFYKQEWLKATFPLLQARADVTTAKAETLTAEDSFFESVRTGKGESDLLDHYLSLHVGQPTLLKIGGPAMQHTRRLVLASLIQHSGTFPLCAALCKELNKDLRDLNERPLSLLIDIWKGLQRVLERIIRLKQETGLTYEVLCGIICQKAELLSEIQPSFDCASVRSELELVDANHLLTERHYTESGTQLTQKCSALVTEVIEFFLSPMKRMESLRGSLLDVNCAALMRIAAFRSLQLLTGKLDKMLPGRATLNTSSYSSSLLSKMLVWLPIKFSERIDVDQRNYNLGEHYLAGLMGLSSGITLELKTAFEHVYELIAQHIKRSMTICDSRDQSSSLAAWNIIVHPEDHMFFNRVNIFNVFHEVLEEVRKLVFLPSVIELSFPSAIGEKATLDTAIKSALGNIAVQSRRLANLVLTTVHCLAVQVASVREGSALESKGVVGMQRAHSGPDTLSRSLFDLMYAELKNAVKCILPSNDSGNNSSIKSSESEAIDEIPPGIDSLEGEDYICRILRLLRLVSDSKVCQKQLSGHKWLSLLLSLVGYGSIGVQRRVLRLLHRLLVSIDPMVLSADIPAVFVKQSGVSESFVEEEEEESLDSQNSAVKVLVFLFRCLSVVFPGQRDSYSFIQKLVQRGMADALAAEALLLLRVLYGIPAWRKIICTHLERSLDCYLSSVGQGNADQLEREISLVSACALIGGFMERLRPGGFVMLKPFCLLGSSDNHATKLAAAYHTCGMLVSQSTTTSSVEVVLMERNVKLSKIEQDQVLVQHTLSLAGSLPVRSVRLTATDVLPCADLPFVASLLPPDIVKKLWRVIKIDTLGWLSSTDGNKDVSSFGMYAHLVKLRAFATCIQSNSMLDSVLGEDAEMLSKILQCAVKDVQSFSLATLEASVDYVNDLFHASEAMSGDDDSIIPSEKPLPKPPSSDLHLLRRAEATSGSLTEQSSSSPLRDFVAMLSPYGGLGLSRASQPFVVDADALAQMLEIGLPREWCEFALKRCQNSVEMAINLCLEHGGDMDRLIAQDAAVEAARTQRESSSATLGPRRAFGRLTASLEAQSLRREDRTGAEGPSSTTTAAAPVEAQAMIRQLLDMGFPPSWCIRAIESNQNNLDAALGWILTHDEELMTSSKEGSRKIEDKSEESLEEVTSVPNPLIIVSGSCDIRPDLTCSTQSGFPSVGVRSHPVSSGKWYYELTVHTAGCVQVGWAATGYQGAADNGQGVGDDIFSWAFDGWRTYLWHETCVEWGTRWAAGDVVGCAVDLDNRTMSFFLNGFGEEVGMGVAFTQFDASYDLHLELFPCASFNRNEKVTFNFGSTPFRNDTPPGYRPYLDNISIANNQLLPKKDENALEEFREEKALKAKKLFVEEVRFSSEHTSFFHCSKSRRVGVDEMNRCVLDVGTLYTRLIMLRCLRKLSALNKSNLGAVAKFSQSISHIISSSDNEMAVLKLLQVASSASTRTKVFLLAKQILPPHQCPPQNLGSTFSIGGVVALEELRESVLCILRVAIVESSSLLRIVLDEIKRQVQISASRANVDHWKSCSQVVPVVFPEASTLSDEKLVSAPSLLLATWLTSVCVQAFSRLISEDKHVNTGVITHSLTSIVDSWVLAIHSPSASVKLCGIFVLSVTMEDILALRRHYDVATSQPKFTSLDPVLMRLQQQAVKLMAEERVAAPVYSTYLQHLLELISALSYHRTASVPNTSSQSSSPFGQLASEDEDVLFSWEGVSGRMLADKEGWQTWSGKVSVQALDLHLPISSYRYRGIERQDFPPELMPGCKVAQRAQKEASEAGDTGKDGEMHRWMRDSMSLSPSDSISRLRMIFERSGQGETSGAEKTSGDSSNDSFDRIGTVKSICDWPNDCVKGRARAILWEDGTEETIRWGAEGAFDAHHVSLKNGKVVTAHPHPPSILEKLSQKGFGTAAEYGVIVRFRRLPRAASEARLGSEIIGIVEWPDFSSVVLVKGHFVSEDTIEVAEKTLLRGSRHSGWERLRGTACWESGSTYRLTVSQGAESSVWQGSWEHTVVIQSHTYKLQGEVELQQARLFVFDANMHASNVVLSRDLVSACKSGGGQGCAFGNVGFSQGVHVWELKVEQADVGSVFIGVAEKTADLKGGRLSRWTGMGLVNNRVSYRSSSSLGERGQVYGDHFHSGDLVCVVLDLNAGKLSFFLDGMKYGEHAIADLGEAFDGLVAAQNVKPRVYFPIVGLSKNVDRVTISPRWLSSIGISEQEELSLYQCSYQLLSSWNAERSDAEPLEAHRWIYREGWRNFHSMNHSTALRVRCRSASTQLSLALDTSFLACLEASLQLGLLRPLLPGDRVAFTKSSGRVLSSKEEAVILGAYQRTLWYKLDAQASSGSNTADNTASIWSLLPSDIEGLRVARLAGNVSSLAESNLADILHKVTLPRLPQFRGCLINILHDGGAVMRDGLEIDHSEVLCTVPKGATLYALERRVNASNIMRFLVYYNGRAGWISERMRGGAEDVMVQAYGSGSSISMYSAEELQLAQQTMLSQCKNPEHIEKLNAPVADTIEQAVDMVISGNSLSVAALRPMHKPLSFDSFRALASTADDGCQLHWTVEMDMQLCEMASRHATKVGIDPSNFTLQDGKQLWQAIQTDTATINGALRQVGLERLLARLCILRAANAVIFCTLPFFQLVLPEERLGNEDGLPEHAIDTVCSLPNSDAVLHSGSSVFNWADVFDSSPGKMLNREVNWTPGCIARKLRSLRRLLFSATKQTFWESLLGATITPTTLHQDEYEDPREIKLIRVNRVKATLSKLASIKNSAERVKQSVFGQLHKEMRSWPASQFRRAYVGKGHGGQCRAFKVKFLGEGVNDYGGPYRAVFEQVVDELQCDAVTGGTGKVSDKCLLPLLLPCPNKVSNVGSNQDKFLFNSHPSIAPMSQEFAIFLGRLVGMAVRHHLHLALDLSLLVWRPLVKLPLSLRHLATVDSLAATQLEEVIAKGTELEEAVIHGEQLDKNFVPEEWADLTFTTYLPDGSRLPLVSGGFDQGVSLGNWRHYVALAEQARLQESAVVLRAFREGLASVLPVELFPLFTPSELEHMICGSREVDIDAIVRSAEYEGWEAGDELVQSFWSVLKELSSEEKTLFLRFVWARSRLPSLAKELPINFKLQKAPNLSREQADQYLPHAQTCFFSLSLPQYSSRDILKEKLLYAIKNSPNMDADVRLHNAEGWADA